MNHHKKRNSLGLFAQEILLNPRSIGAALPSSKSLARKIAAQIPKQVKSVVELGPGTGVITEALLEQGIDFQHLTLIERSPKFAAFLKVRFPQLHIIEGDAVEIDKLLKKPSIDVIVSSLPFRSLPQETVTKIIQQLEQALKPGGLFIQFTYSVLPKLSENFQRIYEKIIWTNLPPAKLGVYRRK